MIKPTVLLILLMSVVGYIFCKNCHLTTIKFSKSNGYHTFLSSAGFGGGIFIFSSIIFWISICWSDAGFWSIPITYILSEVSHDILPNMYIPIWCLHFTQISIIALLLTLTLPKFLMTLAVKLTKQSKSDVKRAAFKKIANTDESPEFTSICFKSWEHGLPVAFTMSNKKVYIGIIAEGAGHLNDIIIIPLKSGYRCEAELRLEIVTHYEPVFREIESNLSNDKFDKFYITLPIREIIHANLHDFERRDLFRKYEHPKKKVSIKDKIQSFINLD